MSGTGRIASAKQEHPSVIADQSTPANPEERFLLCGVVCLTRAGASS